MDCHHRGSGNKKNVHIAKPCSVHVLFRVGILGTYKKCTCTTLYIVPDHTG